jgi:putative endonuclease
MTTIYILYSHSLKSHYVGQTSLALKDRLRRHLTQHKGFTARAKDWTILWFKVCDSKTHAIRLEKKIKASGAKRFLKRMSYSLSS